jgi:hypothetical protein
MYASNVMHFTAAVNPLYPKPARRNYFILSPVSLRFWRPWTFFGGEGAVQKFKVRGLLFFYLCSGGHFFSLENYERL